MVNRVTSNKLQQFARAAPDARTSRRCAKRSARKTMKVINIHSREYPVASAEVVSLVDTLSSENDFLWPHQLWPRMKFDKPLTVSANGGHGPI